MKLLALHHRDQNFALLDPWSVVHLAVGLGFGLMKLPWWAMAALGIGYEVFEQAVERTRWGHIIYKTSGAENGPNIASDLVLYAIGWAAGRAYMAQPGETIIGALAMNPRRRRRRRRRWHGAR